MTKECRFKKKCQYGKSCRVIDDEAYNYCGIWKNMNWGEVKK